jgi:hypothetical protein
MVDDAVATVHRMDQALRRYLSEHAREGAYTNPYTLEQFHLTEAMIMFYFKLKLKLF